MRGYWSWLFKGDRPGLYKFFDRWFVFHVLVGASLAMLLPISLQATASSILLPLASVTVGLSFAWSGSAQALLQSAEIEQLSSFRVGGIEEYVYTFQTAVLCVLITLVSWCVAGLGVFDLVWPKSSIPCVYGMVCFLLFFMSSVTVRECWHVVVGAQQLLLLRYKVRMDAEKKTNS